MRYQTIHSFEKHLLGESSPSPVYLIAIPDDYERAQVLGLVSSRLSPASEVVRFSPELDCVDLFDALQSPSLFGGEPVVLLEDCDDLKKKEVDRILEFLQTNRSGSLVLSSRGKTPFAKVVEKMGVVCDLLDEKPWDKEKRLSITLSEMAKRAGKRLGGDAPPLLFERLGRDAALLVKEMEKLICYVGERPTIERSDIFQISSLSDSDTAWQMAEEIVWERGGSFDPAHFPQILFSLRSQLQIGLKITSLLEAGVPSGEWGPYFPKMWPRTLEKRRDQAMKKGSGFFKRGLDIVYKVEALSRSGASSAEALFDLVRVYLG